MKRFNITLLLAALLLSGVSGCAEERDALPDGTDESAVETTPDPAARDAVRPATESRPTNPEQPATDPPAESELPGGASDSLRTSSSDPAGGSEIDLSEARVELSQRLDEVQVDLNGLRMHYREREIEPESEVAVTHTIEVFEEEYRDLQTEIARFNRRHTDGQSPTFDELIDRIDVLETAIADARTMDLTVDEPDENS